MAATKDELSELHTLLAKEFKEQITKGTAVVGKDGVVVRVSPGAATLAAARTFLRDNQIFADPKKDESLKDLGASIPDDEDILEEMNLN